MPKIPSDGRARDVWDRGVDVYKISEINAQVEEDAKKYGLSPEEQMELNGAYLKEDSEGIMFEANRRVGNWLNEVTGEGKPQRSSDEILDEAKARRDGGGGVSPTDPFPKQQYAPRYKLNDSRPSILDYIK